MSRESDATSKLPLICAGPGGDIGTTDTDIVETNTQSGKGSFASRSHVLTESQKS